MPAAGGEVLVKAVLEAVHESGGSGIAVSGPSRNPRKFAIQRSDGNFMLWVYGWTLTPGGRPQLVNEYRIQLTSALKENPEGPTVLVGYEPNLRVFAGFDLARHNRSRSRSPSVQVDKRALLEALQHGLAFSRKSNDEIAVGVRPDLFLDYVMNAAEYHRSGSDPVTYANLARSARLEDVPQRDVLDLPAERQRLLTTTSRLTWTANFRRQVLDAYENRCAVTRMQLKVVQAAHILPVPAPGSADSVRNGLALSPTFHAAFDSGLVYLDTGRVMRLNERRLRELAQMGLGDGEDEVRHCLGPIHLPQDRNQWPNEEFISKANRYRGIAP